MLDSIDAKTFLAAKEASLTLTTTVGDIKAQIISVEEHPIDGVESPKRVPFSVLLEIEGEFPPMDPIATVSWAEGPILPQLALFRVGDHQPGDPTRRFQLHFC
ncbi:hypothetical protein [Rhodospirillum sp. A1_3_36]|uniref:hypothetical protein n=1 Tax=Rhodospirillum sp. A1_3_36 TaxID=3391666 RepID=UPI0039A5FC2F